MPVLLLKSNFQKHFYPRKTILATMLPACQVVSKKNKNVFPFQSNGNFFFGSAIHEEYPSFDLCHFNARNKSFYIFRFFNSRYSFRVERREENFGAYGLRTELNNLTRFTRTQPRAASFIAYFAPRRPNILVLICCPAHGRLVEVQDLEKRNIECVDGNSMKEMIPGEDKAFVFLSGRIRPFNEEDVNNTHLK